MSTTLSNAEERSKRRGDGAARRRPAVRLGVFGVSALIVLLFAETGARAVREAFPEPVEWYDANTQVKVEQMDRYQRKGRRADFVFAGTSMVFRGVAPLAFDRESEPHSFSYNAGVLAGMPPVQQRWILEEVEPRLKPRVLVYGLSSLDFQERRYKYPVNAYEAAPATRRGFMAAAQRFGTRFLDIVRFRTELRDPSAWERVRSSRREEGPVERTRKRMDTRGHIFKSKKNLGRAERERMRDNVLRDYKISAKGSEQITFIARTLEERDTQVVFVFLPVPRRYIEVHPEGNEDFAAARRHISRLADRLDVPFLDMSRSMSDKWFVDFTHLGERGAVLFSRKLRKELQALGY